jgi:hypothetical protein
VYLLCFYFLYCCTFRDEGGMCQVRCVLSVINPLNAELNPIRHLLAFVGARHLVHVSRIRVKDKYVVRAKKFPDRSSIKNTLTVFTGL